MSNSSSHEETLLARAADGDRAALAQLLGGYRERLRKLVTTRLHPQLTARVDPSDVVQDTLLVAAGQWAGYARDQRMPFYAWLRRLTLQRLVDVERRHLQAQRRSVRREQPLRGWNASTLHELGRQLWAAAPGPASAAAVAERAAALHQALATLDDTQRDVLWLHYVEDLSLAEVANVLALTPDAARMRHFRALKQLRAALAPELKE